jgi:hypothetical protein
MLFKLYYFKFTRNLLLSKTSLCFKPKSLLGLTKVCFELVAKNQLIFKNSILASSLVLFISGQYPKFSILKSKLIRLSYKSTLRKKTLSSFFNKFSNLALVHNLKFLRVYLSKSFFYLSQKLLFKVINIKLFPEFFILLGTSTKVTLDVVYSLYICICFNKVSNLSSKITFLHSLQFPLLNLIASNR